jgi:hypothetical protein
VLSVDSRFGRPVSSLFRTGAFDARGAEESAGEHSGDKGERERTLLLTPLRPAAVLVGRV